MILILTLCCCCNDIPKRREGERKERNRKEERGGERGGEMVQIPVQTVVDNSECVRELWSTCELWSSVVLELYRVAVR